MNKTCARCLRTVYPVEELKCLDKVRIKHFLFLINLNRASVHYIVKVGGSIIC